ncbi:FAD:protein FMN transferase [Tateyamaria sp. SN6-1]|uniref:FAD:protein FMN transferase n=1 Tax=Tateyamaria sp. SN6-1 TaxID=3092148 RepID=UPI0039F5E7F4
MIGRRRFLAIAASFAATPARAQRHAWTGHAFGAAASIELHGPADAAAAALAKARAAIVDVEGLFSLYDPASALVELNATGTLRAPPPFETLMRLADTAHQLTGGLFDPSVQPLWRALVEGGDASAARALVGWNRVRMHGGQITLDPGQALTFNGIAQGFATDLVADILSDHGFEHTLVNIGEYRGTGGPWRLGVVDPVHGLLAMRTVAAGAIATSSPLATPVGPHGHIIHHAERPRWSTVSVEADSAALADALSTGLVLADLEVVRHVRQANAVRRITLIDPSGDLITV